MRAAALLALCALALADDITPVDEARHSFYRIEDQLWVNVTDANWINAGLGGDVELTKTFSAFAGVLEAIPRAPRPPVDSWLWRKATEKMQVVDTLYKNFVEFVRRQAVPGAVPAPVREWLDLAEGVLLDEKASVKQAVGKLDDLLKHGDLFRTPLQV